MSALGRFHCIVSNLGIIFNASLPGKSAATDDPIVKIIKCYKTDLSIRLIKEHTNKLQIKKLDSKKASQDTNIPSKIIKESTNSFAIFLYVNYNKAVADCEFPVSFKNLNVSPTYKRNSRLEEKNYRPISIFPNLSKIYEKIMPSQISTYFDSILSKH